ncbi:hypothetical protein VitviT2T_020341 [Vitis vinifera]|uniref:Uncharacterized protein n=1 Tax=Vitis vinifera TaxID=29760 RepID=A0ABY9D3L2_VITVI|nr:hypothetical protein VitviT2T_020341 [Vitis vinifera]
MAGRRRWAEVRAAEVQARGRRWKVALFLGLLCRGWISQQKGIFAEEGPFRSPFRSCEIGLLCCEMAHECQRGVSQLRNTLRNEAIAAKIENLTLWGFRSHFAAAKWSYCAAKWHTSAKRWFRSCENFRRGGCWAAKFISQRRAIFAGGYFGLRNFADH